MDVVHPVDILVGSLVIIDLLLTGLLGYTLHRLFRPKFLPPEVQPDLTDHGIPITLDDEGVGLR